MLRKQKKNILKTDLWDYHLVWHKAITVECSMRIKDTCFYEHRYQAIHHPTTIDIHLYKHTLMIFVTK